jgi:hypothetical protein
MAGAYFAAYYNAIPEHRREYARERILAVFPGYHPRANIIARPILDQVSPGKPTRPARSVF